MESQIYKKIQNLEKDQKNYWVFQANPKIYDVLTALKENAVTTWSVKSHMNEIKKGDKIILWVSGDKKGCYALGEVNSDIYESQDDEDQMKYYTDKSKNEISTRVRINITHNLFNRPITKEHIEETKNLSDLKVGLQGTNFSATEKQYKTLLKIAEQYSQKKYWLYAPGRNAEMWEEFYDKGIMGLGWKELGDLKKYNSKEDVRQQLQKEYNTKSNKKNDTRTLFEFKEVMSIGDVVIAKKGKKEYLGYGIVTSDYIFDPSMDVYKNCRKVDWVKKGLWKKENFIIPIKTLTDITGKKEEVSQLIEMLGIEENINLNDMKDNFEHPINVILYGPPGTGKTYETIIRAAEIIEERKMSDYDEALKVFKDNLHERIEFITFHQNYSYEDFIQGLRPDTENDSELTFNKRDGIFKKLADKAHENLVESKKAPEDVNKRIAFEEALEKLKDQVIEADKPLKINETAFFTAVEDDAFRYTGENWTLHNKGFNGFRMKYSDLIKFNDSNIQSRKDIKDLNNISGLAKQHASYFFKVYEIVKGLIPENQSKKGNIVKKNFVMIIDEINRANISRVFGELITLIEEDKRSHGEIPMEAKLPSGDIFIVPSNLYIIGTMNTADKSIALLDIALRRRFEFEPMYPKYNIEGYQIYDLEILKSLNEQIIKLKGHDFQIGHSYFMNENKDLVERMNKKVIPLLLEYFMNDKKEVEKILSNAGLLVEEGIWPLRITGKS